MKKILLIRFSALGDVAMLAPVVREVAIANLDCEFTVLSRPFCKPLFDGLSENIFFRGADIKKGEYKGIRGLIKLFHELDREHYDIVCDMHDVLRTKFLRKLFRLHGYKVYKINKHRELRKLITAEGSKKVLKPLPTAFDNYRNCLSVFIHNRKTEQQSSDNCIANKKEGKRLIGIAPFAAHQGKIYPLEKMEEVIGDLSDKKEITIYLFGGCGKEREIMRSWADKYNNVLLASDVCSNLKDELQLMSRLDVMLSMDSANMHLASLVGTRVVSIWGATHPFAGFLGWGQSMDDCIQRNDLSCRPCSIYGNKPCLRGDMACMNISSNEIVNKLLS